MLRLRRHILNYYQINCQFKNSKTLLLKSIHYDVKQCPTTFGCGFLLNNLNGKLFFFAMHSGHLIFVQQLFAESKHLTIYVN